jgi:hypothetical protein
MTEQLTKDETAQTCFQQDSVTAPMSHAYVVFLEKAFKD